MKLGFAVSLVRGEAPALRRKEIHVVGESANPDYSAAVGLRGSGRWGWFIE